MKITTIFLIAIIATTYSQTQAQDSMSMEVETMSMNTLKKDASDATQTTDADNANLEMDNGMDDGAVNTQDDGADTTQDAGDQDDTTDQEGEKEVNQEGGKDANQEDEKEANQEDEKEANQRGSDTDATQDQEKDDQKPGPMEQQIIDAEQQGHQDTNPCDDDCDVCRECRRGAAQEGHRMACKQHCDKCDQCKVVEAALQSRKDRQAKKVEKYYNPDSKYLKEHEEIQKEHKQKEAKAKLEQTTKGPNQSENNEEDIFTCQGDYSENCEHKCCDCQKCKSGKPGPGKEFQQCNQLCNSCDRCIEAEQLVNQSPAQQKIHHVPEQCEGGCKECQGCQQSCNKGCKSMSCDHCKEVNENDRQECFEGCQNQQMDCFNHCDDQCADNCSPCCQCEDLGQHCCGECDQCNICMNSCDGECDCDQEDTVCHQLCSRCYDELQETCADQCNHCDTCVEAGEQDRSQFGFGQMLVKQN